MTQTIARAFNTAIDHIEPDYGLPGPGATPRPPNAQLSTRVLRDLGVDLSEAASFDGWWQGYAKQAGGA